MWPLPCMAQPRPSALHATTSGLFTRLADFPLRVAAVFRSTGHLQLHDHLRAGCDAPLVSLSPPGVGTER
jgi:hypothetical protein